MQVGDGPRDPILPHADARATEASSFVTSFFLEFVAAWEVAAIAVTLLMSGYLILDLLAEIVRQRPHRRYRRDLKLPVVSVVIPVYNEPEEVVRASLESWKRVRYPAFELIIADDSDVPVTADDPAVRVMRRSNREGFKGGALRYAFDHLDRRSEWMVVFDADFLVDPDVLVRFAAHFAPGVGGVQGFMAMGRNRPSTFLTRFSESCHLVANVLLAGRYRLGGFVGVQGTVEAYNVAAIRSIGGIAPYSTANEDLDTTFRLRKDGWKIVYDPEIVGRGVAPRRYRVFFTQTTRWTATTVREYRRHWASFLRSPAIPPVEKVDSFFFLLTWVNSLVVTPTLAFLPWVLFGLHVIPIWLSILITFLPLALYTLPLLLGAPVRLALSGWLGYYVLLVPGYFVMFRAALLGLFTDPGFTRTVKVECEVARPGRTRPVLPAAIGSLGASRAMRRLTCTSCRHPLARSEVLFYAVGGQDLGTMHCRACLRRAEWGRFQRGTVRALSG